VSLVKPSWLEAPLLWSSDSPPQHGEVETIRSAWPRLFGGREMVDEEILAEHVGDDYVARLYGSGRVAVIGVKDEIRDTKRPLIAPRFQTMKVVHDVTPPRLEAAFPGLEALFRTVDEVKVFGSPEELLGHLVGCTRGRATGGLAAENDEAPRLADAAVPTTAQAIRFFERATDAEIIKVVASFFPDRTGKILGYLIGSMETVMGTKKTREVVLEIFDKVSAIRSPKKE